MKKLTLRLFSKPIVIFHTFLMLFIGIPALSQESTEEKLLLVKANELVFSDPDETIKIANHLLKKDYSQNNKAVLNTLLSNSYKVKGDYIKSTSYVFEATDNGKKISDSLAVEIAFIKADLCRKLQLYNQMDDFLDEIKDRLSDIKNKEHRLSSSVRIDIEKINALIQQKKYDAALNFLKEAETKNKEVSTAYNCNADLSLLKANIFKLTGKIEESSICFKQAFDYYKNERTTNTVLEIKILLGTGQLYFAKKDFTKALDTELTALQKAVKLENQPFRELITYQLAEAYLALGNLTEHQKYFSEFLTLNDANLNMENEAVNSMYNLISRHQDSMYVNEESRLKIWAYSGMILLIVVFLSGVTLFWLNKGKRRQLKEIIGYLEVSNKLLVQPESIKKDTYKKITISTETESVILSKLKKFEGTTKFTNKDMSLATLAAQLDVNTKYLSEIINKHYNDNFNTYINKLRINYIIEKLKNEPEYLNYKISYLADESGFSSHSSFATVFKAITGIAPTVFIDLIGKEVMEKKA